jgi:hypothetical protein
VCCREGDKLVHHIFTTAETETLLAGVQATTTTEGDM